MAANETHANKTNSADRLSYDPDRITHIRPERPAEVGVINALVMQAFADNPGGDGHQSFVVERLRDAGLLTFSFVSIKEGRPVGNISVFPVEVTAADGKTKLDGFYALGPLAVLPDQQGTGHGSALVNHAIGALHGAGAKGVLAYGDTAYFSRFGFTQAAGIAYPDHDQAKLLGQSLDGEELPEGTVAFPAEYEDNI